eukprot:CAMPEP_0196811456 /NCGR_PEP_ID=MMETSP1362-20130617/17693_1 /TAXON_ID=163516 /ORGANISM="Leptocylindrus danicus, Strain CCMP1856" /LENGTH=237 /DNA_ID=CAMNT_0042186753 /DNA_START=15 /DNA_END=728 /DNA_ORIENTATION=+
MTALELLDDLISDLEARLNLAPGASLETKQKSDNKKQQQQGKKKEKKPKPQQVKKKGAPTAPAPPEDQPDICKLEFKVGQISKVWVHPDADKLYCEEIECGEETPRQIASGLRPYYTEEQMLGQRLLVVANLKAKNLVGFKSFGMVLCAAGSNEDGSDKVEFIEPPEGAQLGEVVTFEGLPPPVPLSGSQVEKKKVFQKAMEGMKTNDECLAAWNGHVFMTSAGPCKSKTVAGGPMR